MKIEIQNLGPIHRFEFDLEKDLHLLYGENNVGKSFATNILFCILSAMSETDPLKIRAYLHSDMVAEAARAGYHVKDENWEDRVNHAGRAFFEKIFEEAKRYLTNTYATLSGTSGNLGRLKLNASDKNNRLHIELNEAMEITEFDFQFADYDPNISAENMLQFGVNDALQEMQRLVWKDVYQVYFLPTFRSGVYQSLSNMGALFAKLSTQRSLLNGNFDLPGYGAPIADFYLKLMGQYEGYSAGKIANAGASIEKDILHGEVFRDDFSKKIYFRPDNEERAFHVTETSSMVSELAPLVLFLKHVVRSEKDKGSSLLIVEEPEAHLHPQAQVQLMEIFAELTRHNVKVILTSHSDFMFNKLSNMLLAKEIEPEKVAVYHMVMTEKGSIVKQDMQATEEGIEDHNFADVSEDLYNERIHIYQELNEAQHATR